MTVRMTAYRLLQRWVVERYLLPQVMSEQRLSEANVQGLAEHVFPQIHPGRRRAWFHAASVGELESLTPVILEWAARGDESVVTILSESAEGTIERLRKDLAALPGVALFLGYSPWEGGWKEGLIHVRPSVFLTAKYEAWPELWVALEELKIPLLIVSAKARRSLKIAGMLCRVLGGRVPKLKLLTVRKEDTAALRSMFSEPQVEIQAAGEPRWDRVRARSLQGSPRARDLIHSYRSLPRPWGVLGSVWPEDMELWRGRFAKGAGTLWVVPHRVDAASVEAVERYLTQGGLRVTRTSQHSSIGGSESAERLMHCVVVDEIGFLLELYSSADWAYVGGGFGISMHSTIEPAVFGIPIACGPHGAEKFPEIEELVSTEQLSLLYSSEELDAWLSLRGKESKKTPEFELQRSKWLSQAHKRLGATQRILEILVEACRP